MPTKAEAVDWDLLQKIATGEWGKRTGLLVREGYLVGNVTNAGLRALSEWKEKNRDAN